MNIRGVERAMPSSTIMVCRTHSYTEAGTHTHTLCNEL